MIEKLSNPFLFNLFLLQRLPLAWFAGLRLIKLDQNKSVVSVPFRWITKNPFRSMYFAAQAMAAEFTTGVLAASSLERSGKNIAMLIVANRAEFFQKATGRVTFTCEEGRHFDDAINQCISVGQAVQLEARSIGKDIAGNVISEFHFTWSFKVR
jgi:hypothetical protein